MVVASHQLVKALPTSKHEGYLNEADYLHEVQGEGDWRIGEESDSLYTLAAGPCIVLAAVNTDTRRKILGHFNDVHSEQIGHFLQAVKAVESLGGMASSHCVLLGASHIVDPGQHIDINTKADQLYAEGLVVHELGGVSLTSEWSAPNTTVDVGIGKMGDLAVHSYNHG